MNSLKIALIGAGLIGQRHIDLIKANPACQLAGICDVDPRQQSVAGQVETRFYTDLEHLCQTEQPDGAIIATPNQFHAASAEICARYSIPMLIEKPLAESISQAERIVTITATTGVPVLVGHHRRHNPLVQKTREVVQGGDIGQLVSVSITWLLRKPDDYFELGQWRAEPSGGGPILINLIHDIDNLRYICGNIEQIFAYSSSAARGFPVEDTVAISFRFKQGGIGSGIVSDVVPAPWSYELTSGESSAYPHYGEQNCYIFAGTKGSLTFPQMRVWHYPPEQPHGWYHPLAQYQIEVDRIDPLVAQLDHFLAVIRGEASPLVSAQDGLQTLATTLAVRESAQRNAPINL